MTEKDLSSLRNSKRNCATLVENDDTRLMQWRVTFGPQYSSNYMNKCGIQSFVWTRRRGAGDKVEKGKGQAIRPHYSYLQE